MIDDLDPRSTVIVLGDARTNGRDPRADIFAQIAVEELGALAAQLQSEGAAAFVKAWPALLALRTEMWTYPDATDMDCLPQCEWPSSRLECCLSPQ